MDAGFDHLVLMGVGPNQAGFTRFFAQTLAPELRGLTQQSRGKGNKAGNGKGKTKRK